MRQYFDRVCRVVIDGDNQLEIEDCKINFEITKSANSKENTGKIEIHNLTPETRALLHESNFDIPPLFPRFGFMQYAQKLVCQYQTFCLKVGT